MLWREWASGCGSDTRTGSIRRDAGTWWILSRCAPPCDSIRRPSVHHALWLSAICTLLSTPRCCRLSIARRIDLLITDSVSPGFGTLIPFGLSALCSAPDLTPPSWCDRSFSLGLDLCLTAGLVCFHAAPLLRHMTEESCLCSFCAWGACSPSAGW